MATFGNIGEFNERQEPWSQYVDRLNEYCIANGIENAAKKRAILNSVVGAPTYKLISSLFAPAKPSEKSFDEIVELLTEHYTPAKSAIMYRFHFHRRHKENSENIGAYVASLRHIARDCKFGETLNERLRDQLIFGVNNRKIQNSLLAQGDDLTMSKALELAQNMESAFANTKILAGSSDRDLASSSAHVDSVGYSGNPHRRRHGNNRPHQSKPLQSVHSRIWSESTVCPVKDFFVVSVALRMLSVNAQPTIRNVLIVMAYIIMPNIVQSQVQPAGC